MRKDDWQSYGGGVVSRIRKKDGKRLIYIRYTYQGKRIIEKVFTVPNTKKAIEEAVAKARVRLEAHHLNRNTNPDWVPPKVKRGRERKEAKLKVLTFAEFGELFIEQYASKRTAVDSWFQPMVNHLTKHFGKKRLDEITRLEVERFITKRISGSRKISKVKPETVNHDIRFLKLMFKMAIKWKRLRGESPIGDMKTQRVPPPSPEEEARRFLTEDQTNALIEWAPDHVEPIIQLALLTGMRRGELLGLTWPQIKDGSIRLHKTKSGKERRLPVSPEIAAILERVRASQKVVSIKERHVFLSPQGKPMKGFKTAWESTRKRAGLPHTRFHDLRHTWASRMLQSGVSMHALMTLGGWSSLEMITSRYGHVSNAELRAAMETLNGTVGVV